MECMTKENYTRALERSSNTLADKDFKIFDAMVKVIKPTNGYHITPY